VLTCYYSTVKHPTSNLSNNEFDSRHGDLSWHTCWWWRHQWHWSIKVKFTLHSVQYGQVISCLPSWDRETWRRCGFPTTRQTGNAREDVSSGGVQDELSKHVQDVTRAESHHGPFPLVFTTILCVDQPLYYVYLFFSRGATESRSGFYPAPHWLQAPRRIQVFTEHSGFYWEAPKTVSEVNIWTEVGFWELSLNQNREPACTTPGHWNRSSQFSRHDCTTIDPTYKTETNVVFFSLMTRSSFTEWAARWSCRGAAAHCFRDCAILIFTFWFKKSPCPCRLSATSNFLTWAHMQYFRVPHIFIVFGFW